MISSVFPLVDIFCMQTSWATHVINIMALNNCDQNSCGVGLHNPEHFLYVSYAPNNDNKNIEIIENISVLPQILFVILYILSLIFSYTH